MAILPHWQVHPGRGPHLLLVHGFLSSSSQWMLNIDALRAVCTPVTVELFGHARSPSPTEPNCYTPDYYVDCFEAIRTALGVDRWFVLGYSLGAGLTLRYALEYPQRVFGHLFTNSTSGLADVAQQDAWRASSIDSAEKILAGGRSAMVRIPVHPHHARTLPDEVQAALLADAELHDPGGIALTMRITTPDVSMRERLAGNTRPACLIWGQKERRFAPHAAFAESHMPALTIVPLDAGHGMNMEAPEPFNRAVIEFIEQCPTSSTP